MGAPFGRKCVVVLTYSSLGSERTSGPSRRTCFPRFGTRFPAGEESPVTRVFAVLVFDHVKLLDVPAYTADTAWREIAAEAGVKLVTIR